MVSIAISSRCRNVEIGEEVRHRSLRVIPLIGESRTAPAYRLYSRKFAGEDVEVTEVDDAGTVPNLRVKNGLDVRLFIVDGQELIGCKQNRIMNTDVLVPAHEELTVPVTCVEQGRWGYRSAKFSAGSSALHMSRALKSSSVHAALRAKHGHVADQGEIWDDVSMHLCSLKASSSTESMRDIYEQREVDLEKIRADLELPDGAVGFAVYDGDRFAGLEIFDRRETLSVLWDALADSYGLGMLAARSREEQEGQKAPDDDDEFPAIPIDQVLQRLSEAEWERFDAPGEGANDRWESDDLTGSALVLDDDAVMHLQVFPRIRSRGRSVAIRADREADASEISLGRRPARSRVEQREGTPAGTRCSRCGFLYGYVRCEDGSCYCNHCGLEE